MWNPFKAIRQLQHSVQCLQMRVYELDEQVESLESDNRILLAKAGIFKLTEDEAEAINRSNLPTPKPRTDQLKGNHQCPN